MGWHRRTTLDDAHRLRWAAIHKLAALYDGSQWRHASRMPLLSLVRYRFDFRAIDDGALRAFSGSAWRGVFGTALKRTVCAMRLRPCEDCPLLDSCHYPTLFEGHRPKGVAQFPTIDKVAVPYVMEPTNSGELVFARGDPISVVLTLVGHANQRLVYVVRAMGEAGLVGIGPARARLELEQVVALEDLEGKTGHVVYSGGSTASAVAPSSPPLAALGHRLRIVLRSPLRLRIDGDLVTPARFAPGHLVVAAIRRVSSLAALHCGVPIEDDYAALAVLARAARLTRAELRWHEQQRFSGRQKEKLQAGGIVGTLEADLPEGADRLVPWLALGQWVGAGKGASMGLGQYRVSGMPG